MLPTRRVSALLSVPVVFVWKTRVVFGESTDRISPCNYWQFACQFWELWEKNVWSSDEPLKKASVGEADANVGIKLLHRWFVGTCNAQLSCDVRDRFIGGAQNRRTLAKKRKNCVWLSSVVSLRISWEMLSLSGCTLQNAAGFCVETEISTETLIRIRNAGFKDHLASPRNCIEVWCSKLSHLPPPLHLSCFVKPGAQQKMSVSTIVCTGLLD